MKTEETAQAFEWDFDGSCAPGRTNYQYITFSLGCFQWVPRASLKGLKRGPVAKRIRGYSSHPEEAYARAKAYCDEMNAKRAEVEAKQARGE